MPKKMRRRAVVVTAVIPATIDETFGLLPGGTAVRAANVADPMLFFAAYATMQLPGQAVAAYDPAETNISMRVTDPTGDSWLVDDIDDFVETFWHSAPLDVGDWIIEVTNIGSQSVNVHLLAGAG